MLNTVCYLLRKPAPDSDCKPQDKPPTVAALESEQKQQDSRKLQENNDKYSMEKA